MQDTFARATHQAKRARDDRVSCIQAMYEKEPYEKYMLFRKFIRLTKHMFFEKVYMFLKKVYMFFKKVCMF